MQIHLVFQLLELIDHAFVGLYSEKLQILVEDTVVLYFDRVIQGQYLLLFYVALKLTESFVHSFGIRCEEESSAEFSKLEVTVYYNVV